MFLYQNIEDKTKKRIEKCLKEMVDIEFSCLDEQTYRVVRGSAIVYIHIESRGMNIIVRCTSYAVIGPSIDAELMAFLLEANSKITFGGFAIDEDADILFEYSLIASNATPSQLKEAVKSVAKVIDDYDNKIINRWGGETGYKAVFGFDAD